MEFTRSHDRINNIPISLELRNLPATITSLCNIHGINVSNTNIQQLGITVDDKEEDCDDNELKETVKKVQFSKTIRHNVDKPKVKSTNSHIANLKEGQSNVQCWLCDGPHTFCQCSELTRMKNLCFKRPQVKKHFQQLLLQRNGDAIKVLLDAPDLFDDDVFDDNCPDHTTDTHPVNDLNDASSMDHVNTLRVINNSTFTSFDDGINSTDVTKFPTSTQMLQMITSDDDLPSDDFCVLAVHDPATIKSDSINIHPDDFPQIIHEIEDIDQECHMNVSEHVTPSFYIADISDLTIPEDDEEHIHSIRFQHSSTDDIKYHRFTTQVDGGADRCTTPHRTLVDNMRLPDPNPLVSHFLSLTLANTNTRLRVLVIFALKLG
jgi:hypothetical protein